MEEKSYKNNCMKQRSGGFINTKQVERGTTKTATQLNV